MKVFFWRSPNGNFGDDVNLWIWDLLLPGHPSWAGDVTLIGVGSLLGFRLPEGRKLVLGTGFGYGKLSALEPARDWDVRCVRGPNTAAALGLPRALGVGDPVTALCRRPEFAGIERSGEILFVPHWQSAIQPDFDWERICAQAGIACQSPCEDPHKVIRRIAAAKLVLAESLHAAIVADAFRVPWLSVRTTAAGFNAFKWADWAASLELETREQNILAPLDVALSVVKLSRAPLQARASRRSPRPRNADGSLSWKARLDDRIRMEVAARMLQRVAGRTPLLSDDRVHARQLDRYEEILEEVRRDYAA